MPVENKNNGLKNVRQRKLLWGIIALFFVCHLYYLNAPPNGYHNWRESDTMSIVANYHNEDMNFLHPRVNQRGTTSGITGSELPIYQYSGALLMNLFGFSHLWPHLLTVLAACLSLWLFFNIVSRSKNNEIALYSTAALAFSPLFFFYSFKIMPDIWMFTLYLGALYLYIRYRESQSAKHWFFSVILLALSGAIKPLGLLLYLPFFYLWLTDKQKTARGFWALVLYTAFTFTMVLGWFLYAKTVAESSGTTAFYMGHLLGDFEFLFHMRFLKKLFFQWPWELWVGWHFVPLFFFGLYRSIRDRKFDFFYVWILAGYILFALVAAHASSHDYYGLIILPPLAVLTGYGFYNLARLSPTWKTIALILVLAAPIGAFVRVGDRLGQTEEYEQIRASVDAVIPKEALVMVRDNTNAIRLYQLDRKGWALLRGTELSTILDYARQGAQYLLLEEPIEQYLDSLDLYFEQPPRRVGPLFCYRYKN